MQIIIQPSLAVSPLSCQESLIRTIQLMYHRLAIMDKIIPTWGYKSDGSAKIFDLEEGEDLPDGWSDRPEPWHHPNTAHLYKRPDPTEADALVTHSVTIDMPPEINLRQPYGVMEPEAPPMKPRRGRPRKSET
jgi:hypothetical protein